MNERPSDRALLNEAIDLLCGCAPMAWIAKDLNDAAEYEKQITAFIARVRTLDAAQPAGVAVAALDVFRIAGGDVECNPNPSAADALECLRDLRECYDEALAAPIASQAVAGAVPEGFVIVPRAVLEGARKAIGKFTSDEGWDMDDMDAGDALDVALASAPPPPASTNSADSGSKSVVPTAEHWRRAVSDFVLEQGVHLAANDWTHIEQRAVALARGDG
jgi:hypothetical protein